MHLLVIGIHAILAYLYRNLTIFTRPMERLLSRFGTVPTTSLPRAISVAFSSTLAFYPGLKQMVQITPPVPTLILTAKLGSHRACHPTRRQTTM
jgi:hypothetical protein